MKIGVFSKIGSSGGSEHRCAEMANAISAYGHIVYILAEKEISDKLNIDDRVIKVTNVFKPAPLKSAIDLIYSLDSLLIVNSDSHSFSTVDYWQGLTDHHNGFVDLNKIKQMCFLYNFGMPMVDGLAKIAEKCNDVRIICANRRYFDEVSAKHPAIIDLPRLVLNSPINIDRLIKPKTVSDKIRIGRHSKSIGYKFDKSNILLINIINRICGDKIIWDFMGVPQQFKRDLLQIGNVLVRDEYSSTVSDYLASIDIFLFLIEWSRNEPWARVIAEALSVGIPVVATNRGGNRDQVINGNNGFVCDDVDEMAIKLLMLINDDRLRSRMGRNAKISSFEFEASKVASRFIDFISV